MYYLWQQQLLRRTKLNITKLHGLTTSLRDANSELENINLKLEGYHHKVVSDKVKVLWETPLKGYNLDQLAGAFAKISDMYHQSDLYDIDNSWFSVGNRCDLGGDYQVLQLNAGVFHTKEENLYIRKVLLDKQITLVTMCADLEKQIKEMVNV